MIRIRTGVLCVDDGQLLVIEMEDPLTRERFHSVPGGGVEKGETIEQCAVRETLEETGYQVELTSEVFTSEYPFTWNGQDYDCTTHWFTAELTSGVAEEVDDADYLLRAFWLPIEEAKIELAKVPANKAPIDHFLNQANSSPG